MATERKRTRHFIYMKVPSTFYPLFEWVEPTDEILHGKWTLRELIGVDADHYLSTPCTVMTVRKERDPARSWLSDEKGEVIPGRAVGRWSVGEGVGIHAINPTKSMAGDCLGIPDKYVRVLKRILKKKTVLFDPYLLTPKWPHTIPQGGQMWQLILHAVIDYLKLRED